MPSRKLPPLNALRAFEAAARHGGFIGASEELHVTRGAISRHIKLLEHHLGVQLFVRQAQGVRLTTAGQGLLPVLSEAFDRIAEEARRLSADASDLRITCPPGTSIRWLLPRLDAFRAAHPDVRVRLTTDFLPDGGFDPLETDIAFSVEHWPSRAKELNTLTLFPVLLSPACAPAYVDANAISGPDDLARCELLHETRDHLDWVSWMDAFGVTHVDPQAGQNFPNIDMATKAAVMGVGVVMADMVLCRAELDAGLLVMPFPDMVCDSPLGGICLIGARPAWDSPHVAAFRAWAYAAAQADRDACGKRTRR